jgi:hypothetical protein
MGLGLRKLPGSDLFVSAIDDWFISDSVPLIKAAFLAQHGVFRRFNPGAERWPSPPDQKQGEHNA